MEKQRRSFITALVLAAAAAGTTSAQAAAPWPVRPITIVVPYAPGGNTDLMARLIGEQLSKALQSPVVIDNKAGAAGLIAAEFVARSPADGYTLFIGTLTQISTAPFTNKIRYDPLKDFVPIANVGGNPFVITVNARVPARDIKELVAYAKQNPGKLNMGNAGIGGLTHLSGLVFAKHAGVDLVEVPYKGAALALADVVAGQIDMYSGNLSEVVPYVRDTRVRLLGVSSKERVKQLPDVPTLAEFVPGIPAVETWNGLLGPAGMPADVVDKISAAVLAAQADPAFRKKLEDAGITPLPEAKDQFAQRIQHDIAVWKPMIEMAGIKPE
ncbi:MAG: tripartite tricarboxylate transporter substrate binding protein [Pigmentiphaga sp.]|uniref:Bug family tripartite tricarboxylate transporter substrate binding protein n=1 Tax=Pigmentiphaga sp. TaxID=1977564 RepID=UPI0029B36112|nr:tripartite tricarboxylate transporter substrate binding protein [Pigmentiphaga sp.]MDX3904936.1 tripartite tricarboxylate transporter substrate binding protein [Pigmentiphaga sp.]